MAQIKRMLVPTDFSPASDLALEYAVDMAFRCGASIHLLHVLEDPVLTTAYPDGYFVELPDLLKQMTEDAERRLRDAAKMCATANVDATTQVIIGRPARSIAQEAADRGVDLIVMGTHGRGGFAHLVLGSVAERILRIAPCPVLTVRETKQITEAPKAEASARSLPTAMPA